VYSLQNNIDGVPFPIPEPGTLVTAVALLGGLSLRRHTSYSQ
jgi:hypothetical protein